MAATSLWQVPSQGAGNVAPQRPLRCDTRLIVERGQKGAGLFDGETPCVGAQMGAGKTLGLGLRMVVKMSKVDLGRQQTRMRYLPTDPAATTRDNSSGLDKSRSVR